MLTSPEPCSDRSVDPDHGKSRARFQGGRIECVSGTGEIAMLTFEDCLAFCALGEEEIDAIAEHEHIGETAALELGSYLIEGQDGQVLIQHMIVDDIVAAQKRGDWAHAARLKQTLRHCIESHSARATSRD
jgi:hypothetical protein